MDIVLVELKAVKLPRPVLYKAKCDIVWQQHCHSSVTTCHSTPARKEAQPYSHSWRELGGKVEKKNIDSDGLGCTR